MLPLEPTSPLLLNLSYTILHPLPTRLGDDSKTRSVCRDEAQEGRIHVYLKGCDGTHHAQIIHLEETVTGKAGETAGEATAGQQVAMHVKI